MELVSAYLEKIHTQEATNVVKFIEKYITRKELSPLQKRIIEIQAKTNDFYKWHIPRTLYPDDLSLEILRQAYEKKLSDNFKREYLCDWVGESDIEERR